MCMGNSRGRKRARKLVNRLKSICIAGARTKHTGNMPAGVGGPVATLWYS